MDLKEAIEMDLKAAMEQVRQAVYAFVGNRRQHEVLDQSLRTIQEALYSTTREKSKSNIEQSDDGK
jgi:hypothetical protein